MGNFKKEITIALINAEFNLGQEKSGTELGPNCLKTETLFKNLKNLDCKVVEYDVIKDVFIPEPAKYHNTKNFEAVGIINKKLSETVCSSIEKGYVPVTLGGDHSLAIGSVHGSSTALSKNNDIMGSEMGLIWVDAHADINTPLTSDSGNLHGQPVSFILHELDEYLPGLKGFEWNLSCLPARNMVYIGLRDLDPAETILIKNLNIKAYSMSDVQRIGIHQVMKEALEHLTINNELLPIHCSFDIDSIDPYYAPSTGTPVLGGLSLTEAMYIGNKIHETGKLRALDLVEVNPLLSENIKDLEKTIFSAHKTLMSFFGYNTIGTIDPSYVVSRPN